MLIMPNEMEIGGGELVRQRELGAFDVSSIVAVTVEEQSTCPNR